MKTPEEIKKGLRGCADNSQCQWCSMRRECREDEAALAYIEQLEQRLAQLEQQIDTVHAELEATNRERIRLMTQVAQLAKERDAAVADLREADRMNCARCLHFDRMDVERCEDADCDCGECAQDCACKHCGDNSCWEWRGVQEGKA